MSENRGEVIARTLKILRPRILEALGNHEINEFGAKALLQIVAEYYLLNSPSLTQAEIKLAREACEELRARLLDSFRENLPPGEGEEYE
jgi:hypothetical protein